MDNREKINQTTREEFLKKIMESLGPDGVASRTLLVGEAGIGKSWLAKEVSKRVTQERSSIYNVLWLYLNKRIEDVKSLYENLASQLSIIYEFEEGEEPDELDYSMESLKEKVTHVMSNNKKKNLLLILDDEGSMTTENHVMEDLNLREFLNEHSTLKLLITRRDEREEKESITIKVTPLTEDESRNLLRSSQDLLKSFTIEDWPDHREINEPTLMSCILSKSKGLPAAIVVLTKSLDNIKSFSAKQRKIFTELILSPESLDAAAASKNAIERNRYNPVLRLSYELLKLEDTSTRPVIACFWHILDFYKYSGCAYYRDLIVHWMLEGYFDPVKSVEKAYQEGHSILMEFMNRGILKIQEDNMVVPEFSMSNLLDLQDCGFFGRSCLGFHRVYGGDKRKGLGKIILIDDMIQTIQSKQKKITTIIASGNRLRREVSGKFFKRPEMQDLEVVVLFEPTFQDLVLSLSKLNKLRVLVIRDCDLIQNIDELTGLKGLHVLEVSGASSLNSIPDDFFKKMSQLQSLNLSGLAINSSPSTIENLKMLRCFILRECSELQDLPNFNVATKELEVIDIRGARKLESYFDRVKDWKDYKGKNKNFAHLRKLEHLDFSETQIIRLPIFHFNDSTTDYSTMPSLTRLLLRNCTRLKRLPQLKPLTNLRILDASGATSLVEMLEVCLEEKKELRILDISKTILPELADTIADVVNLNQLLLRNCSQIEELPSIENLTHLEVFDVSGCNKLKKIDGSFGKMSYLHKVNLSETNLGELPDKISDLSNLKELIIRNCSKLKALPNLEKLTYLEILDVSGCTELEKIEGSFENMSYLREVNLSGTKLNTFPELPKQSILCSSKRIVLANSACLEREDWSQIKECLAKNSDGSIFSKVAEKIHEKDEKLVHQGDRYRVLDLEVPLGIDIVDINNPMNLGAEFIAKAEYVSITENGSRSVSSIFDEFQMRSVKGCWVERCKNMNILFESDEQQEKEKPSSSSSLENLWISNLPLLKSLHSNNGGFIVKNLKKLSIDCCPSITSLFPVIPGNLEILRVKFCDKLERLFEVEVGELSKLNKLQLLDLPVLSTVGAKLPNLVKCTIVKCPNLKVGEDELRLAKEEITEE
ncbi:PREDICTED: putative disease resistance protein At4g19050 [Camelina sativa]|uniref:Disease resistance protein At4g19050 n=1 Tax=Camelina sativa TaxID=90675 RepID=A0ABM1QM22_CAMSA|nr:PREDICTED: putative disease resistance protein At4g19050 [Camelina sativa]